MSGNLSACYHDGNLHVGCVAQEDLLVATGHLKLQACQRKLPGPTALRSHPFLHCAILSVYHLWLHCGYG